MSVDVAFPTQVLELVRRALDEDGAGHDLTSSAVVPEHLRARGWILAREPGVLAGCAYAEAAFRLCDPGLALDWHCQEGERLKAGTQVLSVAGVARGLLAAERTALNFLQQLSGVATATARAVQAAYPIQVLHTRKTVPGLRAAQQSAVLAGGGVLHRSSLADQILLKENHFALSGLSYQETVERAVQAARGTVVGAEARTAEEAAAALAGGVDYVLLDNFPRREIAAVVQRLRRRFPRAVVEASGGLHLDNLSELGDAALDRISLGALTHSAAALDLSFYVEPLAEAELEQRP